VVNCEDGIASGGLTRELISTICDPLFKRALFPADCPDILWFPRNGIYDENQMPHLICVAFLLRLAIQIEELITNFLPLPFFRILKNEPMSLTDLRIVFPEAASEIDWARTSELFEVFIEENVKLLMDTQISIAVDAVRRAFHGEQIPSWASSCPSSNLRLKMFGDIILGGF
jgi:hypothetical protein